jgi:hypothetical protein
MKKLLLMVLLGGVVSFCFAGGRRDSFEFAFAFPYGIEKATENSTDLGAELGVDLGFVENVNITTKIPSFALNFSGTSYFSEYVGLGLYADLIFPQKLKLSALGQSITINRSAYDTLLSMDFLLGPTVMAYQNGNFSLPISFGAHFLQMWAVSIYKVSSSLFGFGANITGEYHFNETVYALLRFQLTFDFYAISKLEEHSSYYSTYTTTGRGTTKMWGINPVFGIGFSF